MKIIEIYALTWRYFVEQGFTNWKYAKACAKFVIEGDSHVAFRPKE